MAIQYGKDRAVDFAAGNLMTFAKSFSAMNGQPLDNREVWYDRAALEAAAQGTTMYVGQKVTFVDVENQKVYQYSVQLDGTLKEIGVAPVSDGATIAVDTETGKLSLYGVAGLDASKTYVPSIVNGVLTWAEPDTSTAEGQAQEINALKTRATELEKTVNGVEAAEGVEAVEGLVDKVATLETKVGADVDGETPASGLFKEIDDVAASVESEAQARASADEALGKRIDDVIEAVEANDGELEALTTKVGEIETGYAAADSELARRITALEGTTHFAGTGARADMEAIEAPKAGDVYVISSGEGLGKEFIFDGTDWIELGDVTAEQERIKAVEDRVTEVEGDITEINTALEGKAATEHTHEIADVTGLQDALDGKEAAGAAASALAEAKSYADGKDAAIQAAKDAADAAQADVDAVPGLISTAKQEAINDADGKLATAKSELQADIDKNAEDIAALAEDVANNKSQASSELAAVKTELEGEITAVDGKADENALDIANLAAKVGEPAGETEATGLYADIATIAADVAKKVDTATATQNSGVRFINQNEIDKLKALSIDESGSVGISGTVSADNVQGLAEAIVDVVTGTGVVDEAAENAVNKLAVQAGAQVNIIEAVKVNGAALTVTDKAVDITLAALGIVSSEAQNQVKINSDKTMEVNSVNVNKLVQTEGEELILNGGGATL